MQQIRLTGIPALIRLGPFFSNVEKKKVSECEEKKPRSDKDSEESRVLPGWAGR